MVEFNTNVSDYNCSQLTDCDFISRNLSKPVFSVVPNAETYDRICMTCEDWDPENAPENTDLPNYDKAKANAEYKSVCTPNIDNEMSTGTKVGISIGALVAAAAVYGIYFQHQKKKRLAEEKKMADIELDRTKDELELGSNMMMNPMQSGRNLNNTSLIEKGKQADAEILKLRDEVRRLKILCQRKENSQLSVSTRGMSKLPSSRKKEFGQTR